MPIFSTIHLMHIIVQPASETKWPRDKGFHFCRHVLMSVPHHNIVDWIGRGLGGRRFDVAMLNKALILDTTHFLEAGLHGSSH
jgi:hypothetical protein